MKEKRIVSGGFTLIEMLVAISIMLLMVGGGIASYVTFQERRLVITEGQELTDFIRLAQQKASVKQIPKQTSICNQGSETKRLVGYRVTKTNATNIYIVGLCGSSDSVYSANNVTDNDYAYTLPSGFTTNPNTWQFDFFSLQGTPVVPAGSVLLRKNGTSVDFTITITAAGAVSGSHVVN